MGYEQKTHLYETTKHSIGNNMVPRHRKFFLHIATYSPNHNVRKQKCQKQKHINLNENFRNTSLPEPTTRNLKRGSPERFWTRAQGSHWERGAPVRKRIHCWPCWRPSWASSTTLWWSLPGGAPPWTFACRLSSRTTTEPSPPPTRNRRPRREEPPPPPYEQCRLASFSGVGARFRGEIVRARETWRKAKQ